MILSGGDVAVDNGYVGRFAPSPTGRLHIGSLFTAVASYLDARANNGRWLVRIEDLDPLREETGAADDILRTLIGFGLEWDGEIWYQSHRNARYHEVLEQLKLLGLLYPCYCSRKRIQSLNHIGVDGFVYDQYCLHHRDAAGLHKQPAWRIRVVDEQIVFDDAVVGYYSQNLQNDIGDFVLKRADGFWAYQLAVVVDDADQKITNIVRGQDLLVSTPRQIYLQYCLGYTQPNYAHVPLLTNQLGQKWSKQTLAPVLSAYDREKQLRQVMCWLGLPDAPDVDGIQDLLNWGINHWNLSNVPVQNIITG